MPVVPLPLLAAAVFLPVCLLLGVVLPLLTHRYIGWGRYGTVSEPDDEHCRCRYCSKGVCELIEQSIRYEGMEIVQTQLFACSRCGLPHWLVTRSPQEWRAVR